MHDSQSTEARIDLPHVKIKCMAFSPRMDESFGDEVKKGNECDCAYNYYIITSLSRDRFWTFSLVLTVNLPQSQCLE